MVVRQSDSPHALFTRVDWIALTAMLVLHGSLVAVPFTFTWGALGVFLVLHWLSGCVGISLGYHRVLTHRAIRVARPVEMLIAVCGCLAWQLSPKVIFLDVIMPRMDGWALLSALKADPQLANIPMLIMVRIRNRLHHLWTAPCETLTPGFCSDATHGPYMAPW